MRQKGDTERGGAEVSLSLWESQTLWVWRLLAHPLSPSLLLKLLSSKGGGGYWMIPSSLSAVTLFCVEGTNPTGGGHCWPCRSQWPEVQTSLNFSRCEKSHFPLSCDWSFLPHLTSPSLFPFLLTFTLFDFVWSIKYGIACLWISHFIFTFLHIPPSSFWLSLTGTVLSCVGRATAAKTEKEETLSGSGVQHPSLVPSLFGWDGLTADWGERHVEHTEKQRERGSHTSQTSCMKTRCFPAHPPACTISAEKQTHPRPWYRSELWFSF